MICCIVDSKMLEEKVNCRLHNKQIRMFKPVDPVETDYIVIGKLSIEGFSNLSVKRFSVRFL